MRRWLKPGAGRFVLRSAFFAMLLLAASFAPQRQADAAISADFRHGLALFHPLISATLKPGATREFVFPPFADDRHRLTQAQLAIIRNAGFNFVRLPVDPGPFLQFQGGRRDALDDILRQRVHMILNAGLAVIVDFHPIPSSAQYGPRSLVQGTDTPLFQSYCSMLARTALLLEAMNTGRVALELMNEPAFDPTPEGDARWQAMQEQTYARVRKVSPHLTLVLTGGRGSDAGGLLALDPGPFASDASVIYTFHYYDPGEFVFQSLPSVRSYRLASDVPYPAQARPLSDSLAALTMRVARMDHSAAQGVADLARGSDDLIRYRNTNFGRGNIHRTFEEVAVWARDHDIPPSRIFLGEFGVIRRYGIYNGARDEERARWLQDVRQEADSMGFIWSVWAYSGYGGMAIVKTDSTDEIDPVTLEALFAR